MLDGLSVAVPCLVITTTSIFIFFLTSRMTAYAIIYIIDSFFAMLADNAALVMLVTTIASVGRKTIRVTGLAVFSCLAVPHGETMGIVVLRW